MGAWLCGMASSACDSGFSSATITAEEFRFSPKLVKLPAGQKVRLIVRNQGRERHVFQSPILVLKDVLFDRKSLPDEWKGADGIQIQPGERIEFSLELSEGLYPFRCRIKGHKGMEGTLIVVK
jgi:plastocyanin